MKHLAKQSYWDSIYNSMNVEGENSSFVARIKAVVKHLTRDYSNYLLWESVLPQFLPTNTSWKIIEVGVAPGKYVLGMHRRYGYIPYGIEYSPKGVEITRSMFRRYGVPEENVIEADFFDDHLLEREREKYNVVFSRGFIEHYDDPASVVARHAELVSSGGYIVISIPNLSGVNGYIARHLNKESYDLHNRTIMNTGALRGLFPQATEVLYVDYIGICSVGLFNTHNKIGYILWRCGLLIQRVFDLCVRILLPRNTIRSVYTSPYILAIARKK